MTRVADAPDESPATLELHASVLIGWQVAQLTSRSNLPAAPLRPSTITRSSLLAVAANVTLSLPLDAVVERARHEVLGTHDGPGMTIRSRSAVDVSFTVTWRSSYGRKRYAFSGPVSSPPQVQR